MIERSRTALHSRHWIDSLENHLPTLIWHAPIDSIKAPALLDAMIEIQRKVPETATRIRQRLEAVFNDAELRGLCSTNPARTIRRPMTEALDRRQQKALAALPYTDVPHTCCATHWMGPKRVPRPIERGPMTNRTIYAP